MATPTIDVRRSADRFTTTTEWLESRHSFSFGAHYDPVNVGHALLVAHNDDVVAHGTGYDTHPHRDMEIVTWVLEGSLVHEDSSGHTGIIHPGLAQRMSAGSGIRHSERNDAAGAAGPTRFIQMWVLPDEPGLAPGYAQREVGELSGAGLVAIASGMPEVDAAVRINNPHAALHVARLAPGESVQLPEAPYLHVFVARGDVELEGAGPLTAGDAVRFTAHGGPRAKATGAGAEVLTWEMHAVSP
jgi:quercetin 2,3-dioxygenase